MNATYKITGKPRHYAWGGKSFIPQLFQLENPEYKIYAEWWLGAHPDNSSTLIDDEGHSMSLLDWLATHEHVQDSSERNLNYPLPFLMKVLDVNEMLAIQVHPTKQQAVEGFARQNLAGIEQSAPERTYRDRNDKPEMMVALTSNWLAHGFCDHDTIVERLNRYPCFSELCRHQQSEGTRSTFELLMYAEQDEIDRRLLLLLTQLKEYEQNQSIPLDQPEYWINKAFFVDDSGCDRGLLALFLMNIVNVPAGKGIYQDAGIPHAYLSGQNVELMANSDNVVRIGPTKLHVDIPELMTLICYDVVNPKVLEPIDYECKNGLSHYDHQGSNAFKLKKLKISEDASSVSYKAPFLSLFLLIEGEMVVQHANKTVSYHKGDSFILPCNTELELLSDDCLAYIASYGGSEEKQEQL